MDQPVTLDQVSDFLVSQSFLLSALELFQESLERGQVIPKLEEYFTNDAFLTQLSKDRVQEPTRRTKPKQRSALAPTTERDYQKRIKTLEYDLRQDRQNLQTLRRELQDQFGSGTARKEIAGLAGPHHNFESKTLNFLLQQHLIRSGYKMTAISFNQEVGDSNLTDWKKYIEELYGVEEKQFPSLDMVYRYFLKGGVNKFEFRFKENLEQEQAKNVELTKKLEESTHEISEANQKISELEARIQALLQEKEESQRQIENQTKQIQTLEETLITVSSEKSKKFVEEPIRENAPPVVVQEGAESPKDESGSEVSTPVEKETGFLSRRRNFSSLFVSDIANMLTEPPTESFDSEFSKELLVTSVCEQLNIMDGIHQRNVQNMVNVFSKSLPGLIKRGVIVKRREELIPLLIVCVAWGTDESQTQLFSRLLFDLIPVPTDLQRHLIMQGCVWLSKNCDVEWIERHLIPLCIEQITSPFIEKRMLVADFCGHFGVHVVQDLRLSLLLSLLVQLQGDNNAQVREAVALNTAKLLLVSGSSQSSEKYTQVEELVLLLLQDSVPHVSRSTRHTLFPIFSNWCEVSNLFTTHLIPGLFQKINEYAESVPLSNPMEQVTSARICLLIDLLIQLVPQIVEFILAHFTPTNFQSLLPQIRSRVTDLSKFASNMISLKKSPSTTEAVTRVAIKETKKEESSDSESESSEREKPPKTELLASTDSDVQIVEVNLDDLSGSAKIPIPTISLTASTAAAPPVPTDTQKPKESSPAIALETPNFQAPSKFISLFSESELPKLQEFLSYFIQLESFNEPAPFQTNTQELMWLKETFIPKILEFAYLINPIQNSSVTQSICSLCYKINETMGLAWTELVAQKIFLQKFEEMNTELNGLLSNSKGKPVEKENPNSPYGIIVRKRNWITPIYLCSIQALLGESILKEHLRDHIVKIACDENHWKRSNYNIISTVFSVLMNMSSHWTEFQFNLLWELIVHPDHHVRSLVLKLFLSMSRLVVDEKLVAARILPAFITLSADMNSSVRVATVGALGELAVTTTNSNMLDKIVLQMEMMLSAGDHKMHREMIRVFGKIMPNVTEKVRDEFILRELFRFTNDNTTKKTSKKKKGLEALYQAYTSLSSCTIPLAIREKYVLPGLDCILKDEDLMDAREKTTLSDMHRDLKALVDDNKKKEEKKEESSVIDKKEEVLTAINDFSKSLSTRWNIWSKEKDKDKD